MSKKESGQTFLGGAAILAAAVAVVKIFGAVYRLPVNNILSAEGKTYFNIAYNVYNVLLTISTAGLPLAISKLTSQAQALGRRNERRKIFTTSIWLFLGLGVVLSLLMFFGADALAGMMTQAPAALAIRALAPSVFCICLLACMRGYTQGQGNMTPTAISQTLEVLIKLGVGLPLAWYLVRTLKRGGPTGGGAILGLTAGEGVALCLIPYLLATYTRLLTTSPLRQRDGLAAIASHHPDNPPLASSRCWTPTSSAALTTSIPALLRPRRSLRAYGLARIW